MITSYYDDSMPYLTILVMAGKERKNYECIARLTDDRNIGFQVQQAKLQDFDMPIQDFDEYRDREWITCIVINLEEYSDIDTDNDYLLNQIVLSLYQRNKLIQLTKHEVFVYLSGISIYSIDFISKSSKSAILRHMKNKDWRHKPATDKQKKVASFNAKYQVRGIFKYNSEVTLKDGFVVQDYHHFIISKNGDVVFYVWDSRTVEHITNKSNLIDGFVSIRQLDNCNDLIGYQYCKKSMYQVFTAKDFA